MSRTTEERLWDILDAIQCIYEYSKGMNYKAFLQDRKTRDAVVRNIEIIGEAVRSLPPRFKQKHPDIAWKDIIGMRNVIVHHYFGVLSDVVWNVVKKELPSLEIQIKKLVKDYRFPFEEK
jgi:uncharacterized protein with HEPN domain